MAGHIPEDKVAEIRHAIDIVEVIGESVLLKKTGKNFSGLCPFHAEKTPSFTVSPDKQIFHCFGCGAGGNVFSFVMKRDGVGFAEAARSLAVRGGVELPERSPSPRVRRQLDEQAVFFELNRQAADYFRQALVQPATGRAEGRLMLAGFREKKEKSAPLRTRTLRANGAVFSANAAEVVSTRLAAASKRASSCSISGVVREKPAR